MARDVFHVVLAAVAGMTTDVPPSGAQRHADRVA